MSEPQVLSYEPALVPPSLLPRLDSLDILRGVAILGILLMNTQSMGLPSSAYLNPTDYGAYTGANRIVWMVIHIVADMKFITTFSILFGAGILLQGERVAAKGMSPAGVHYRRMAILLLFGLIHAYALWYGDVLVPYALCGMILFPFRKLPAPMLMLFGVLFVGMGTFMRFAIDHHLFAFATQIGEWTSRIYAGRQGVDYDLTAYRGGWLQQMDSRFWISLDNNGPSFLNWLFWRCGGCMLIGMALQKSRFFHMQWSHTSYGILAALCIPVGWSITGVGIAYNDLNNWDWTLLWSFGEQFNYWGSLIAAFGYLSLGVLVAITVAEASGFFSHLLATVVIPIRSVGRMALSNYISDTLIGTTFFYGHGFGNFGKLDRVHLLYMTITIWICQLTVSTIYMRFFKQGPLEWLWHRLVYGTMRKPMARQAPVVAPVTATA